MPPRQHSPGLKPAAGQRTACTPFVEPLAPLPLRAAGIDFSGMSSASDRSNAGLRPVAGADLAQDRLDVNLYRRLGDRHFVCYGLVGRAQH